jgi:hypothetical protein
VLRINIADPPKAQAAWQAASLLVGLFGREAGDYAAEKLLRCLAANDLDGATTWSLIESQIDLLLTDRIDRKVN